MDRKFLIILFATVFYNGVTHSSPVEQQISDAKLPEEKPTVKPPSDDHINEKKEHTPLPTTKSSVPVTQNLPAQTSPPPHVEVSTTGNATSLENATHVVDGKKATHDAVNQTTTNVVDNKPMNQTAETKNITQTTDNNKNSTQPADNKNGTASTTSKNETDIPVPSPPGPPSSATPSATPKPTTTAAATTTGNSTVPPPKTSSVAPSTTSTSKDAVITGQNTPAPPSQEKHFDGASFVGGIVLTIGLTAIGFIAFKYYKSGKIDMSYRTL